jgi:curved DNA-binding protein CbpA
VSDGLEDSDYYELLGVPTTASADAIRRAFHIFALRFHPDRYVDDADADRERAAEVYRRGAEGYRVLMDAHLRRKYDDGLADGHKRLSPEDQEERRSRTPTTGRLTVSSPRARPFVAKAQKAWQDGDYKTARLNLKMALAHEPDNILLKARLADVEKKLGVG